MPIPNQNFCLTLAADSILKDRTLSEFWNGSCQAVQSELFLPHLTVYQGRDSRSLSELSNFTEVRSSFWKTTVIPKVLTQQPLSVFLPASAIPKAEKGTVTVTGKIRIYPENESDMSDLLSLAGRAYNLATEHFKNTPFSEQLKVTDLRKKIKIQVKAEWEGRNYRAEVAGEAVRDAFKTRSAVISERKKGLKCDYKFKSVKEVRQSFVEQRLTKKFMGNFFVTEEIGEESFGRTTDIIFKSGRWFVCAPVHTEISLSAENQGLKICSADPGVRIFATTFDGQESVKYGDGFYSQKVFPLLPDLDNLISGRQIFLNSKPDRKTQAFSDKMRFFAKCVNKLRNRIEDLTDDLHRRVAYDLVTKNDVILLPIFETKDMASKQDRKISSKTVRSMLGLAHYKFKQTMQWMCLKYGKTLVDVNEAYTSKTMSWCGKIKENLGGSKIISDGIIKVDRDINAARNILLKSIAVA